MANAFKQKQDQAKREKLLADCKAQIALGPAGRQAYAKAAGASTAQAEAVLGLR